MKRVCSWCQVVIDPGYGRHASLVTYGICLGCKEAIDGQISAAQQMKLAHAGYFPCPECPGEGVPYRVRDDGQRRTLHVRCGACGLTWMAEAGGYGATSQLN